MGKTNSLLKNFVRKVGRQSIWGKVSKDIAEEKAANGAGTAEARESFDTSRFWPCRHRRSRTTGAVQWFVKGLHQTCAERTFSSRRWRACGDLRPIHRH